VKSYDSRLSAVIPSVRGTPTRPKTWTASRGPSLALRMTLTRIFGESTQSFPATGFSGFQETIKNRAHIRLSPRHHRPLKLQSDLIPLTSDFLRRLGGEQRLTLPNPLG